MLDIQRSYAAIIACHASAAALDSMPARSRVHPCRVAADELLLLAPPSLGEEVLRQATAHVTGAERGTLVLDQSDGWVIFSLRGDDAMRPLRQLSVIPFPDTRPAFVQGAVAGGAAKVLLLADVVHLLVPFALRQHVERRLRDVCGASARIATRETPFDDASPPPPQSHSAAFAATR